MIKDQASTHRSRKTQAYLHDHPEIMVEELPPYSPELNPEEYCHGNIKQRFKAAQCYLSTRGAKLVSLLAQAGIAKASSSYSL